MTRGEDFADVDLLQRQASFKGSSSNKSTHVSWPRFLQVCAI